MDWRSRVDSMKTAAKSAQTMGADLASDAIEQHWPAIQRALREHVAPAATAPVTNDQMIDTAVRSLHRHLPLPIRLVIRQQRLVDWCFSNRERVLAVLRSDGTTDVK